MTLLRRLYYQLWFRFYYLWRPLCWIKGHDEWHISTGDVNSGDYNCFCLRCCNCRKLSGRTAEPPCFKDGE